MNPRRIALLQLTAIGDTLVCEPALQALRDAYPDAHITFITSDAAAPILEHHPALDDLVVWRKKSSNTQYVRFLLALPRSRYDVLLDFQKSPRTWLMSQLIRARRKLSFRTQRRNFGYSQLLPAPSLEKYVPWEKLRLAEAVIGRPCPRSIPRVYVTQEDEAAAESVYRTLGYGEDELVIAVSPVSKVPYRLWKPRQFARLCDDLHRDFGARFVFTWGPGEKHFVDEVLAHMCTPAPRVDYSIPGLRALYAIFARADMYLGNDNGPRHLAIGAGIATFTPFGHFFWPHWTPPVDPLHRVVQPPVREHPPGGHRIDTLPYDEVRAVCSEVVQEVLKRKAER